MSKGREGAAAATAAHGATATRIPGRHKGVESGVYPKVHPPGGAALLDALERLFQVEEASRLSTAAAHTCVQVLEQLAEEEGPDGLFAVIEAQAPRLASRVSELRNEHDDLRFLTSEAFRYASLGAPASAQHAVLQSLWFALSEHFIGERATFQEAFLVDLGGESGPSEG